MCQAAIPWYYPSKVGTTGYNPLASFRYYNNGNPRYACCVYGDTYCTSEIVSTAKCNNSSQEYSQAAQGCITDPNCAATGQMYDPYSGTCMSAPTCPAGQAWQGDISTGSCQYLENLPASCGDDQIANTSDDGTIISCSDLEQPTDDECSNIIGYVNNSPVCGDSQDQCSASGGTYGFVNGEEVCISGDYSDNLPTCDIGSVQVDPGGGGFACSSPSSIPSSNSGNPLQDSSSGNSPNIDTDGDGINDGWDTDGDGNADQIDSNADGLPDSGENSGTGQASNSCGVRPQCSGGDAQQCAILTQLWVNACGGPNVDVSSPSVESLEAGSTPGTSTFDFASDPTGSGSLTSVIGVDDGTTGACPADTTLNLVGTSVTFSWSIICQYAAAARAIVILIFSIVCLQLTRRIMFEG
jgi:hypothetical protein